MSWIRLLTLFQGVYYATAGLWPLLHMPSFLWMTGPKQDLWLVNTVGVLVAVIGSVLLLAGLRNAIRLEVRVLAAASAAGLGAIDFYYGLTGRIWPVYLLDGVAEAILLGLWIVLSFWRFGSGARLPHLLA
ncbi:MAG: hypothetical protein IT158_21295 [Bryobacterales bacterium]|nr:hypothetical protein [Bryobacterales bacterium]